MKHLKCDFHIHTTYSDGQCSIQEILELYAKEKFDVIAITDHAMDKTFLQEFELYMSEYSSVTKDNFPDYLAHLQAIRTEASVKYDLHLIPGIEVSNNTKGYHIVALDIQEWVDPDLSVREIVTEIHRQGGIAMACHPAPKEGASVQGAYWHLYHNRERYREWFDAWEVANRHHLFPSIGLMKVPYLANSDLHRREHIYSWKTSLIAEKFNTDSVKEAICNNDSVSIFLHREK